MTVALYGFQLVPDVRVVTRERGWKGWLEDRALPLIERGYPDQHLHNPFGLHQVAGRDRVMHIDQFELSYCQGLDWLADRASLARVVREIHDRGGTVRAYVGSPLVVRQPPQAEYLPRCSPGARAVSARLRMLSRLGLCGPPLSSGCLCWGRLIGFHIGPLLDASVDAIGFDSSPDFHPGDCMDRLVRALLDRGLEVMIEPWPRKDRDYPRVSWIVREILYERITFDPEEDEAPLASVIGKIHRIVPADPVGGSDELEKINALRLKFHQPLFESVQEVVDAVREDGHIPVVRAAQLSSGEVT
jgi:hypothetical protein